MPVHYMCLSGILGASAWPLSGVETGSGGIHPLDDVSLAPPTCRAALLLAHSRISLWAASQIRALAVLNAPTYAQYDDLNENSPRARFLIALMGLAGAMTRGGPLSASALLNGGIAGAVLSILAAAPPSVLTPQTIGGEDDLGGCGRLLTALEEDAGLRAEGTTTPSGPELAAAMRQGTRVVRGRDWKWGDQVRI